MATETATWRERSGQLAGVLRRFGPFVISTVTLLLIWHLLSTFVLSPRVLPGPITVFGLLYHHLTVPEAAGETAPYHLGRTLVRVIISSLLALTFSVVFGILLATNETVEEGFLGWLPFWMTAPTVVVILVTMVMFDFSEVSIYAAVIVVSTPYGVINFWEGTRDIDADLVEMGYSFGAPERLIWRDIYVPHLMPYIFGSYRYILGLVWKLVVLAEVFGIQEGIGAMFRFYFTLAEIGSVLAYLLLFLGVMYAIEYLIIEPMENRVFRWRDG